MTGPRQSVAGAMTGATVVITDGHEAMGRAVIAEVLGAGGQVVVAGPPGAAAGAALTVVDVDVATPEGAQRLVATAVQVTGRIDLLVNTSTTRREGTFAALSEADWTRAVSGQLRSAFTCTGAAARHMINQGAGCVVSVVTDDGLAGTADRSAVAAVQAGIAGFTRVVCRDLGRRGVRAHLVAVPFSADPATLRTAGAVVVALATDALATFNGQHLRAEGHSVSVLTHPTYGDAFVHPGIWTTDELVAAMPHLLEVEGTA